MSRDNEVCTCLVGATQHTMVCPLVGLEWREADTLRAHIRDLEARNAIQSGALQAAEQLARDFGELKARCSALEAALKFYADPPFAYAGDPRQIARQALASHAAKAETGGEGEGP